MKITKSFIKHIVKAIENAAHLHAYDVRIEEADEWIIRYENLNDCTISLYFYYSYAEDEHWGYQIGYYTDNVNTNEDAKFNVHAWCDNLNTITNETIAFDIAILLYELENVACKEM